MYQRMHSRETPYQVQPAAVAAGGRRETESSSGGYGTDRIAREQRTKE